MRYTTLLCTLLFACQLYAQDTKVLHHGINRPHTNNLHPKLSPDGRYMIYTTDLDEPRRQMRLYDAKYAGNERWTSPLMLDKTINVGIVNSHGGYCLSYDMQTLYIASQRHGGVGKFDIWISDKNGDAWKKPVNVGKPLNSELHDGDPSISPDGKDLYFCRCTGMTNDKASGCTLMVSEKKGSAFAAPKELPANINTGNAMAPMMLADNQTLIFSSDKNGDKGGLDLFLTRKTATGWSDPIALDYINDATDNRYISIPAQGDIAYYSKEVEGNQVLVKAKIPEQYRQKKVIWLMMKTNAGEGYEPLIELINSTTKEENFYKPDDNGQLSLFLAEGAVYDISIRDKNGKYTFESDVLDLTALEDNNGKKWVYAPKPIKSGASMTLNTIYPSTKGIDKAAKNELDRVFHILKNNDVNAEVQVCLQAYKEDTLASEGLTEMRMDTTMSDTIQIIKTIYHNDNTAKYVEDILAYATSKGIPLERFTAKSHSEGCEGFFDEKKERDMLVVIRYK